jgi:fructokinase
VSFTLCIGEALVDLVAQSRLGDVGASELFRRAAGGAVANVAVGIARLGGEAHFAGALSRDAFGHFLLRTLEGEGVDVASVRIVDAHTTLAFVARGVAGERDFVFVREPGADSLLADVDASELERARILHFGGVLLSSEPARSTCLAAAATAARAGALVSFDPNARESLFASSHDMREKLRSGCAAAHLVKLSDEDVHALGMRVEDASSLLGQMTRAVIVSLGARGCRYFATGGMTGQLAAPRIEVVDTTGAGDAMMAAILWRLGSAHARDLTGERLADAARYGIAAGACACLREGAIPSLPTPAELDAMLSRVPQAT